MCEPVGPASRNGNFARRSWAPEGNMPVGRRMVHLTCKLLILALYGMLTVARKHACPSGLHVVLATLQRPSSTQTAHDCFPCTSAAENQVMCCNRSTWEFSCNATTGSQPVHSIALYCLSSAHCRSEGTFIPAAWPNVVVVVAEGDPEPLWGGQRPKVLRRKPKRSEAATRRPRTTPSTSRAPTRMVRLPGRPRRHTRAPCHRRVLRRLPRRLTRWRQGRWQPQRPLRCHLYQLRIRRLQHSWLPLPQQRQEPFREPSRWSPRVQWIQLRTPPRGLVCRFLYRIPSSSTSTLSSGRIRELVWSRQALQTDVLRNNMTTESLVLRIDVWCCRLATDPLHIQTQQEPMQNAPAPLCVDMATLTAPLSACSIPTCPRSGLFLRMDSHAASNLQTAGCQVCRPVRGCSPVKQGLDVAKCSSPHASTGRPGRGLSLTPVSTCLPDSVGRWTARGSHCKIWQAQAPSIAPVCCRAGSCCNLQGSCAQPCTSAVGKYYAYVARGLTRESRAMTDVPRPDYCCNLTLCLPTCMFVSGTDKTWLHTARARTSLLPFPLKVQCPYLGLSNVFHSTFTHISGNLKPLGRLKLSLPREAIMPPPVPLVKRYRYKPGKRERQERREQRAAAEAAWRARRPGQPRPQTVFGGQRSSGSLGHGPGEDQREEEDRLETALLEDEEHDVAENVAATAEVAGLSPDLERSGGHEDAGKVVPKSKCARRTRKRLPVTTAADNEAEEVTDIPPPMTPPYHVPDGDPPSMQPAEQEQVHELPEVSTPPPECSPGWLFNADVMAFASAYNIQSAFVGDTEILIPRPKQAPVPGITSMTTASEDNIRAVATLKSSNSSTATRRSRWPGWKYARLAANPNGTARSWRTSLFAISLKRPWSCNWRQLYREMNFSWQLLSTRTVQDAWRLTCGYRLAFSCRQWPQIQARLANITGHPKCEAIRRLIRAHQRLDERHRPEQHTAMRAYMLGSDCLSPVIKTHRQKSCLPLVLVTGRRLLPLTISGVSLDCALHSRPQVFMYVPHIAGRPMPRPLPGTTPLKATTCSVGAPRPYCPTGNAALPLQIGMCQALGPALRPHIRQETGYSCRPKEHGICVVFLPSPRCQVCYRRCTIDAITYSSDHWIVGSSSTKSYYHAFRSEPAWLDAQPSCIGPFHVRLQCLQVHELSTSPSNKIGPWRVSWTDTINCLGSAAGVSRTLPCSRTNVLTAKTLSRMLGWTGFTALWKRWTDSKPLIPVHSRSCWGLRTRSKVYAVKLPVRLPRYAVARRRATRCHKPTTANTTSRIATWVPSPRASPYPYYYSC